MSFDVVRALVGLCLHWKWLDMAVSIYLSYKALLRMCELVCITYGDFVIAEDCQSFILALYEGKTVTLHDKIENVKSPTHRSRRCCRWSRPNELKQTKFSPTKRLRSGDSWTRFCKRFDCRMSSSLLTACAVEAPLTSFVGTETFTRLPSWGDGRA